MTRIDDDRRRSDPKIPASANWHMNFIDAFSAGPARSRHRTFYDTLGHSVGAYVVPTDVDYRTISGYPGAKASRDLAVADPEINTDTGYPIINMRYPVHYQGTFIGCVGASITLDVLNRFLASQRVSSHSTTIIANLNSGKIIAASEKAKGVRRGNGELEVARLENFADDNVRAAYQLQSHSNRDNFLFFSPGDGQELSASFARFPAAFRAALGSGRDHPNRRLYRPAEGDEPANPVDHHCSFDRRGLVDLSVVAPAVTTDRHHLRRP